MNTVTKNPASDKQISFLSDLLASKEYDAEIKAELHDGIIEGTLDKVTASKYIDELIKAPRMKNAVGARSEMQELLASIPKSKYAIPTADLELYEIDDKFNGDIVFFELKEYMNTLYIRQLHGAPGNFNRSKLTAGGVRAVVATIKLDPYRYAKLFGTHYTCCGSCGAALTDERSREIQLGPECRKKFGF